MQKRTTYKLTGSITAQSHLAVTRPNDAFVSENGNKTTQRLPRMGAKNEKSSVYFPAASLRGAIRRATYHVVRRAESLRTGQEKPFSLETHYMLTQGVDVTNKTVDEKIAGLVSNEGELRAANPFLSLFGRWRLPAHVGIGNGIPSEKDVVFMEGKGARCNDFLRSPEEICTLNEKDIKRLNKMLLEDGIVSGATKEIDNEIRQLKKQRRESNDEAEITQLNAALKEREKTRKETKAAKSGSRESIQRPLDGYEAIIPGTVLDHKMILQNVDETELGLYLAGLREFARKPYVGGHHAHGAGEISGTWTVTTWPYDTDEPITIGKVILSSAGFNIVDAKDTAILSQALIHWQKVSQDSKSPFDFTRYLLK